MVSDKYMCEGQPVGGRMQIFDSGQTFALRPNGSIAVLPSICAEQACFSFTGDLAAGLTMTLADGTIVSGITAPDQIDGLVPCPGAKPVVVQDLASHFPWFKDGKPYCAMELAPLVCTDTPSACPPPSTCTEVSALAGKAKVCALAAKTCNPCSMFDTCSVGKEICWRVKGDAAYGRCVLVATSDP
jgi:hypothetical protein